MPALAALTIVPPDAYAALLPLMPDAPWAVPARGALLAGRPGAYADDPRRPRAVAVEAETPGGRALFLCGDADTPALAVHVAALAGPVTLHADDAIAARLPRWRPDATPRRWAVCTPPADGEAGFIALPPGGVRRLRPADARHLAALPAWLWAAYGTPEAALRAGIAYARYLRAELVSLACITAATERHAAIGAYTIERTRRNGFATECARRLIGAVVAERGAVPVLTCDAGDTAAVALAAALCLTERRDRTVYYLA